MVGRTIRHYRVLEKLGEGGMGVVYRAEDTRLKRTVALKFLPSDALGDPDLRGRFLREAQAAAALSHLNVCTVYEIDEELGFLAMEFLEGETVQTRVRRRPLPVAEALDIAMQAAQGLQAAHERGVVHRDIKSANLMVTPHGMVKIMDFGLAQLSGRTRLTKAAGSVGTPAYMSPEQARGSTVDRRTDLWSVGVVLYEMVTAQLPFRGDNEAAVAHSILHEEAEPVTGLRAGLPLELDRVIAKALAKDPGERYQHAEDLLVDLKRLKRDAASGRSAWRNVAAATWRRRAIVAAPFLAAALLLAGACVGLWLARQRPLSLTPRLKRLTFDSGLTFEPALSPDGKLVAYASDRGASTGPGGNLDIWVQQVTTGQATRLTRHSTDDREPAFSPDGSRIAFRSERDGGGIYVVPAIGGDERLIAPQGRTPRFSPDGQWIAYWVGSPADLDGFSPGDQKIYIVPSTGGSPRQLQVGMFASHPIWTPDGKHLLFLGARALGVADMDWWVTPLDGGAAVRTGAYSAFQPAGFLTGYRPCIIPSQWNGEHVFFSARQGDATNLWRIPMASGGWRITGAPEKISFGAGLESQPSLAAGSAGDGVVFSNLTAQTHVWGLTLDASRPSPGGEPRQLSGSADDREPGVSADGRTLVFCSNRTGDTDVWVKHLVSGRETALTATPAHEENAIITFDGEKVAYNTIDGMKWAVSVVSVGGGVPEKVCDDCGILWDWSTDGKRILYADESRANVMSVGLIDLTAAKRRSFLKHPQNKALAQPHFSPDDRWISVLALVGAGPTQIFIVRNTGNVMPAAHEWIPITDGSAYEDKVRWAPDGNLLYFTSDRDGFRCIWAQHLDPASKRPVGAPLPVYHSHSARRSLLNTGVLRLQISVARDKLVFSLCEITGNIWMAEWKKPR